ncbi:MAG: ras GTPase protein [uncultured bacterium]|nr:MAG: ras GTPase protein [uncultured bacterium]
MSSESLDYPLEKLANDETITFSKKGEGILHYVMDLEYARKKHVFSIDNGMTVGKRFENTKGEPVKSYQAGELYAVRVNMVFEVDAYNVALEDSLPAGFEPVDPNFNGTPSTYLNKASQEGVTENWSFEYLVSAVERRDDRMLVFADYVPAGSYDYVYYVRATTSGHYSIPASRVGEMYAPEIFGQSISGEIEVK